MPARAYKFIFFCDGLPVVKNVRNATPIIRKTIILGGKSKQIEKHNFCLNQFLLLLGCFFLIIGMGCTLQRDCDRTRQNHTCRTSGGQQVYIHVDDLDKSLMNASHSFMSTQTQSERLVEMHILSKQETALSEILSRQQDPTNLCEKISSRLTF